MKEVKRHRYDDGDVYYIKIEPINYSNATWKDSIKSTINQIVSQKGSKVSIDIFDDITALEYHYKKHIEMSTPIKETKKNTELLQQHFVAYFSGELKTDTYLNTLCFFPSSNVETSNIGQYVGTVEFNPVISDDVKKRK